MKKKVSRVEFFSDQMVLVENGDGGGDWADWRGGECLIPALVSFNRYTSQRD